MVTWDHSVLCVVIQQEGDQGMKAVTEETVSEEPAAAEVGADESVNGNFLCDSVAKHHLQPSE